MQAYCINEFCPQPSNVLPPLSSPVTDTYRCGSCGQPLLLNQRYIPLQPKGRGGFGTTYVGLDTQNPQQQKCIIKILNWQMQFTSEAQRLFEQEATVLRRIGRHPQIPALRDYFSLSPMAAAFVLVQDYIEGQTLADSLNQQDHFSEAQVYLFLEQMLEVLEFIHGEGVIHRDIKPANIIRSHPQGFQNHQFFLIDFGAVKNLIITQIKNHSLLTGTRIYTPYYAPPEQMEGRVSPSSDLYSLAVTCLVMLTGQPAHLLYEPREQMWQWQRFAKVSQSLSKILTQMLAPDPQERYSSAAACLQDLQRSQLFLLGHRVVVAADGTGDYTTISAALSQVPAYSRIDVKPGIYKESLYIEKPVEIIGQENADSVQLLADSDNCIYSQASHVKVFGLTLHKTDQLKQFNVCIVNGDILLENCNIISHALASVAIYWQNTTAILQNCRIYHGNRSGIFALKGAKVIVENCNIYRNCLSKIGRFVSPNIDDPVAEILAIDLHTTLIVKNTEIHDSYQSGVYIYNGAKGLIKNCIIYSNALSGIAALDPQTHITIEETQIVRGEEVGILITNGAQADILSCNVQGNQRTGILVSGCGTMAKISDCQVHNGNYYGIVVSDRAHAKIERSTVSNNRQVGIVVSNRVTHCQIDECEITDQNYGIRVIDTAIAQIKHCCFRNNLTANINQAADTQVTVEDITQ